MLPPELESGATIESFAALERFPFLRHGFVRRIPGIDVGTDREEALRRLDQAHRSVRRVLGLGEKPFASAEQVHGNEVAVVDAPLASDTCFSGADGLVTNQENVSLGIYVADCCAVFLLDPKRRCLGLVHSGKKGTELAIVEKAIRAMSENFGSEPSHLVLQLTPCIRPPHYEIDFAAEIVRQARRAGVEQIHDDGKCTACDLQHYYSYRAEKARTGRMLALLALR